MSYEEYIAALESRMRRIQNLVAEYLKFKNETPHDPPDRPVSRVVRRSASKSQAAQEGR